MKQGAVQDEYSPTVQYQVRDLGLVTFSGAGNKAFKFTLNGKNPSSNGTSHFDAISLVPVYCRTRGTAGGWTMDE